jgi:hypothetical protein
MAGARVEQNLENFLRWNIFGSMWAIWRRLIVTPRIRRVDNFWHFIARRSAGFADRVAGRVGIGAALVHRHVLSLSPRLRLTDLQ